MVEDLDLAISTAHNSGLTLPLIASAQAVYRASEVFCFLNRDYTPVASFLTRSNAITTFGKDRR
jgi:3-hydroxyisobutyrate dehydrogenase-like beta-hydroxyacid dehydrogenase